jgi:pimeloyl-ACP methyl ester carboxylesterase
MYYEVHGSGRPLILLHGGAGSTEMFAEIIPSLSKGRQVVAADLQAHGRTADIPRPLRYELMGDDVAALAAYLKLGPVDLMGYSLGAGVALRMAIQHPDLVRKLVVVSTPCKRDGWHPEVREAMSQGSPESAEAMKQSPMYQIYARIAPRPQDWPVLFAKLGEMLRRDYDWSDEVRRLGAPTMLIFGDSDSVRPAHAVEFFELLGGGKEDAGWDGAKMPRAKLAILPGVTHYNIFASPSLVQTVAPFIDAPL